MSRTSIFVGYLTIIILFATSCSDSVVQNEQDDREKLGKKVELPSQVRTLDDQLALLTKEIPGFGGYKFNKDGTIDVFVKKNSPKRKGKTYQGNNISNVKTSLKKMFGKSFETQRKKARRKGILQDNDFINLVAGDFNYASLQHWRKLIRTKAPEIPGIVTLDIDETQNRIKIGAVDPSKVEPKLIEILTQLGIPYESIQIVKREPYIVSPEEYEKLPPADGGGGGGGTQDYYTLDDKHGTFVGGISVEDTSSTCTIGVNVSWDDGQRKGFVTASHCTEEDFQLDYGNFYQGGEPSDGGTYLGEEVVDRELWDHTNGDSYCDIPGYKCRYSDAALIEYNTSVYDQVPIGFVAKPNGVGNDRLSGTGDLYGYEIQNYLGWPHKGFEVHQVGITTGLTTGEITSSCTDAFADGGTKPYDIMYVCVVEATYASESGDSGGPVLVDADAEDPDDGDPLWPKVELAGFHLGGNASNDYAIFSSVHYVVGYYNKCQYINGWLNSEVCDEPTFGPYEFREELAR